MTSLCDNALNLVDNNNAAALLLSMKERSSGESAGVVSASLREC